VLCGLLLMCVGPYRGWSLSRGGALRAKGDR